MSDAAASANGKPVLEVQDVVAGYLPEVDILNGVSINVAEGEIVTVIGPNGAGKSTLIKTIFGLLRPREGSIVFRGEDISGSKPHDITSLGLSYVPQLDNVFKTLTVDENLEMGSLDTAKTRDRMDRMYELFPRLGERKTQAAGTMSGGERQMVAMARALMPDPEILLLDEPMAGINPTLGRRLLDHMQRLRTEFGVTFLFIEHDMDVVMNHADRVIVMAEGRVIAEGEPHEVRSDQAVIDAYLGDTFAGGVDE